MDFELLLKVVLLAIFVYGIVYAMNKYPTYNRVDEGFYGGVTRGSGHPDCLRTLPETSQILDIFQRHKANSVFEDASRDYAELQLLLSKMSCLKKDLLAPGAQVDATRYLAFETAHDRIAVAELCGLCLSQNISSRDLDIGFSTWRTRGKELISRLCTSYHLSQKDVDAVETLFKKAFDDVYNIATSRCLKTDYTKQNGGQTAGDVGAFDPPKANELRSYDFNYGGLSASGWNGAV